MDITVKDDVLTLFLRNLANSIENKDIDDDKLQIIGEIYMKYMFQNSEQTYDESDYKKFMVLGWYIYEIILKNN